MQEKVRRSNKTHMRLRKSVKTKQEAKYHLACAMSQTNILGSKSPDANYNIDTMSALFFNSFQKYKVTGTINKSNNK